MKYIKLPQADIILQAVDVDEYDNELMKMRRKSVNGLEFEVSGYQVFFLVEGHWMEVRRSATKPPVKPITTPAPVPTTTKPVVARPASIDSTFVDRDEGPQ